MPSNYYQAARCQHIKDSGTRCGSPALRGFDFCFYHRRANTPVLNPRNAEAFIPVLENGEAVGLAVTNILRALSGDMIDSKKAYAMFYGIQLMGMAFKHRASPDQQDIEEELSPAMEAIVDTDYSKPGFALAIAREVNRPRPDRGVGTSVRDAIASDEAKGELPSDASVETQILDEDAPVSHDPDHEVWKSGASAARCDSAENGASAPVDASHSSRSTEEHSASATAHCALLTTSQIDRLATHLGLLDSYTREQVQEAWTRLITDHPKTAAKIREVYLENVS